MDHPGMVFAKDTGAVGFVPGLGPSMRALDAIMAEIARTAISVIIVGESGTGKDAYARHIHRLSAHGNSQLRKINCSAFGANGFLGFAPGTEGQSSKIGLARTVYLDNIQELDLLGQRALLSELPDAECADFADEPVTRFICSTTRNLEREVIAGRFRRELYFRLNGACLHLLPLRERTEDIPVLAEHFLNKHSSLLKKNASPLSDRMIEILTAYPWPGNIRELENLLRRIVVLGDVQVALDELQSFSGSANNADTIAQSAPLKVATRAASKKVERELILQALERTHWNRKQAARNLQISYKSLLYKIKQIGVANGKYED
jgi:two-component system, NtrC family, response regulator AtoC